MLEKKVFLICPVRGLTKEENTFLQNYISELEQGGCKVHYPPRDTYQEDPVGLNICSENRAAIESSNGVDVYFNPGSKGSKFDLGMTYMAKKPLKIINLNDLLSTSGSSPEKFVKFILAYSQNGDRISSEIVERRKEIRNLEVVEYEWKGDDAEFLFDFGMAFMAQKPIRLVNRDDVKETPHKSFENVLLELDKKYRLVN